jgi:GT2 family glycosyltransferase
MDGTIVKGGGVAVEPAVAVVVVNFNAGPELVECLETVHAQRFPRDVEVVVVDNASTDTSLLLAQDRFGELAVIENRRNHGFAAAFNQGVRATRAPYVLSLNFDVRLDPGFLAEAVRAIESDPAAGSVAGKLHKFRGEDHAVLDSTGITFFQMFPADRGENKRDVGQYDRPEPVFGASGAAALYRREMLEDTRIGDDYFDEDFFQVVEDVDLAWRAQKAGWKCLYAPKATALHRRGTTRKGSPERRAEYHILGNRNRYLTIVKNLDRAIYDAHGGAIRRAEVRNIGRIWKHNGPAVAWASVWGALRLYRAARAKRAAVAAKTRVPAAMIERFLYL